MDIKKLGSNIRASKSSKFGAESEYVEVDRKLLDKLLNAIDDADLMLMNGEEAKAALKKIFGEDFAITHKVYVFKNDPPTLLEEARAVVKFVQQGGVMGPAGLTAKIDSLEEAIGRENE